MTGIPMLQGWGDEVNQLASGVGNLINPNAATSAAFRKAALENPDLLSHLGEVERNNPGTLQKLGLGSMAQQIARTPLDPSTINKRAQEQAQTKHTGALTGQAQAATDRTVQMTPSEVSRSKNEARSTKVKADIDEATKDAEVARKLSEHKLAVQHNTQNLDDTATAIKKFPSLANIDISKYASDVFNGKPTDPNIANRIAAAGPEGANAVNQYLDAMKLHATLASNNDIAHLRSKDEQLAAAGLFNQSIEQAKNHESLLKDEIIKLGGDEFQQMILRHTANPTDESKKNSDEAIKAREKIAQIDALKNQMNQIKSGYDKLATARDNILNNIKVVKEGGGLDEMSKLGPSAKAVAEQIRTGKIPAQALPKSDAWKSFTDEEKQILSKIKFP